MFRTSIDGGVTDQIKNLKAIVDAGHCVGCGFCTLASPDVTMVCDSERDTIVPDTRESGSAPLDVVCPGTKMDMQALSEFVHGRQPIDAMLGVSRRCVAAYATDRTVRDRSASGGIATAMLEWLFESGRIDVAYALDPGSRPDEARGRVLRSTKGLEHIRGSNYHPASFGEGLRELVDGTERFAFVGLPCEVAALEMLKQRRPDLAQRHVLSIGLFCGGINTYRGIAYYLEGFGVAWDKIASLEYRYGTWPGRIRVTVDGCDQPRIIPRSRHGNRPWHVLRYFLAMQGPWMLPRCRLCPDQIADFADLSIGDPHLRRFRERKDGFSVVIARTERGEELFREAVLAGRIAEESITRDEIVNSQGWTLDQRRHVEAYRGAARFWRFPFPTINVYAPLRRTSFRHRAFAFLDLMKLRFPKGRVARLFFVPWQALEFALLTWAPTTLAKALGKLRAPRRREQH